MDCGKGVDGMRENAKMLFDLSIHARNVTHCTVCLPSSVHGNRRACGRPSRPTCFFLEAGPPASSQKQAHLLLLSLMTIGPSQLVLSC